MYSAKKLFFKVMIFYFYFLIIILSSIFPTKEIEYQHSWRTLLQNFLKNQNRESILEINNFLKTKKVNFQFNNQEHTTSDYAAVNFLSWIHTQEHSAENILLWNIEEETYLQYLKKMEEENNQIKNYAKQIREYAENKIKEKDKEKQQTISSYNNIRKYSIQLTNKFNNLMEEATELKEKLEEKEAEENRLLLITSVLISILFLSWINRKEIYDF
jgi:hypothetical protein